MDAIGRHVRELRHKKKWSMERLAREASLSKQTVIDLELGRTWPHRDTLEGIANALGVSPISLLDNQEKQPA
jgi:transcriptional regulator with XRE-family HTH domain